MKMHVRFSEDGTPEKDYARSGEGSKTRPWGVYEEESSFLFGASLGMIRAYAESQGIEPLDALIGITENLEAEAEAKRIVRPGEEYPVDLLDIGDTMAEFALIEARLVILSDVNGQQRFDEGTDQEGYAVVEHYLRGNKAFLRAERMTWLAANALCTWHIEALNNGKPGMFDIVPSRQPGMIGAVKVGPKACTNHVFGCPRTCTAPNA